MSSSKKKIDEIYIDMDSGPKTNYTRRSSYGFSSKFPEVYPDRQIPEEVWRSQRLETLRCRNNNKDENICPNVQKGKKIDKILKVVNIFLEILP